MKLIYNPASPFVRKVWLVLIETGQIDDVEMVEVVTTAVNTAEEARKANPLGKIPALVLDDGSTLYDSRVICRYLDERAQSGLYRSDDIWSLQTLEATADGIMEAAVLMVYEHRIRPEEMVYQPWLDAQWQKIERALPAISDRWQNELNGPMHIGHIAVAAALGYLDFRHPDRKWRDGNPELAEWFAGYSQRPAMLATQPPGA